MAGPTATGRGLCEYEPPSEAIQGRMLRILHAERPGVYAWLIGKAATGYDAYKPRTSAAAGGQDGGAAEDGGATVRSIVGGAG